MSATITKEQRDSLAKFLSKWNENLHEYQKRMGFTTEQVIEPSFGKKYVKLVRTDNVGSRSAEAFVNLETGDIFKAASWAAPAKHARGNIYKDDNGMSAVDAAGFVRYLR